jgi:glutathione peroxidase
MSARRRSALKVILASSAVLLAALAVFARWQLSMVAPLALAPSGATLYDYTVADLDGHDAPLAVYRGQVALVVNVASECTLAVQYPGLDALYKRYRDRGFVILAFPSNDFWQEPNADADIQKVCDLRGVTFPVFAKSHVRGAARSPVYAFLGATGEAPLWNFAKFLVGRDGRPRAFFGSLVTPEDTLLLGAVERALAEPATAATEPVSRSHR